jgi:hypothetical protein
MGAIASTVLAREYPVHIVRSPDVDGLERRLARGVEVHFAVCSRVHGTGYRRCCRGDSEMSKKTSAPPGNSSKSPSNSNSGAICFAAPATTSRSI